MFCDARGRNAHDAAQTPHVNRLVVRQIHDDFGAAIKATLNVAVKVELFDGQRSIKLNERESRVDARGMMGRPYV